MNGNVIKHLAPEEHCKYLGLMEADLFHVRLKKIY